MDIIQQLIKLVKINTRISSLDSSDEILREIMNGAMSLTDTTSAFILQVSSARKVMPLGQYYLHDDLRVNWSSSSALEAHDKQQLVCSTRTKESSASASIIKGNIHTLVSVPLSMESQGSLLLQLVGQDATSIDPQVLSLLGLFVSQVKVTISKTKLEESLLKNAQLAAVGKLAAQVAHDIRSPLASLDAVTGSVNKLPEDERLIIRGAVNRIKDIANHLLEKNREQGRREKLEDGSWKIENGQLSQSAVVLLSSLIEPLITEKRLQFRSQGGIDIAANLDASSYGLFAKVHVREFKRVLSNLINNSVEALKGKGVVTLSLVGQNNQVLLKVQDNGPGIPKDILAKLGQRGETHGKKGGSGLGLYHARTSLESWEGSMGLDSRFRGNDEKEGGHDEEKGGDDGALSGTTVTLKLPQAPHPDWFVPELKLKPNNPVVILDDDPTIHQVWQARLNAINLKDQDIEVVHFSRPDEIREWTKTSASAARKALYLTDYELLGFKETGLALIEELNLGHQAILVTSRYEEKEILENCQRLGVRLIPKGLAGFVPISLPSLRAQRSNPNDKKPLNEIAAPRQDGARNDQKEFCDAVLIDDDPLVRMTWKMAAKRAGKNLLAFVSVEEFFKKAESTNRNTPIYIDSHLGNGVKGEEESQKLYDLGFKEIYLATGDSPEKFAHLKHIRGVLGKEPPWVEILAQT